MSYIQITISISRVHPEKGGKIDEVMTLCGTVPAHIVWVAVPGEGIVDSSNQQLYALELRTNKDVELRHSGELSWRTI